MSAAGRTNQADPGRQRVEMDAYYTEPDCARTCVRLLHPIPGALTLEPSAGTGSFMDAMLEVHGIVPDAVEPMPEAAHQLRTRFPGAAVYPQRFEKFYQPRAYDLVVGNPPYKHAEAHAEHGLYVLRPLGVLAFLLRLNFLATHKRRAFFRHRPPWRIYVLEERPDFTGEGGDATEYAFFVWLWGNTDDPVVRHFSWRDPFQREEDVRRINELDRRYLLG